VEPGTSCTVMKAHLSKSMKTSAPDHDGGADPMHAPGTRRFSRNFMTGLALGAVALGLAGCGRPGAGVAHLTSRAA